MSTNDDEVAEVVPNRLSGVMIDALEELRGYDALVNRLGGDPSRIYPGQPGDTRGHPVGLALSAVYGGSSPSGKDVTDLRFQIQATVQATRQWRDANSTVAMHAILDAVDMAINRPFATGLAPDGMNASPSTEFEIDDGQRVAVVASWNFNRTEAEKPDDLQ